MIRDFIEILRSSKPIGYPFPSGRSRHEPATIAVSRYANLVENIGRQGHMASHSSSFLGIKLAQVLENRAAYAQFPDIMQNCSAAPGGDTLPLPIFRQSCQRSSSPVHYSLLCHGFWHQ